MKYLKLFENFNLETEMVKQLWEGKYLYHFTLSDNVDDILADGLMPRKYPNSYYVNGCQGVFLTTKLGPNQANLPASLIEELDIYFEEDLDPDIEDNPITRMKIRVDNLDFNKFYPDDDYLMLNNDSDKSREEQIIDSLNIGFGVCYAGNIPSNSITEYTKEMPF